MQVIKTIIIDDHQIWRVGLKSILEEHPDYIMEIVGEAEDGLKGLSMMRQMDADLILLDINMPKKDGLEVLKDFQKADRKVRILILTLYHEPKLVKAAFKNGADGYILKECKQEELYKAISEVIKGKAFLGQGVNSSSIEDGILNKKRPKFEDRFMKKNNLTKRELEILSLITDALSNKEIAKKLYISDQTVSVHRKNIMRKLGVNNAAGLIKVAYENRLI